MPQQQARQITVNDIIHADQRVIDLKKKYNDYQAQKNNLIIELSRVEADIIKTMGAFCYLNQFTDIDEAQKELLPEFRKLVTKKHIYIAEIQDIEVQMEATTKKFNEIAEIIVAELKQAQKQFTKDQESAFQSAVQSAEMNLESAPERKCDCPKVGCNGCDGDCQCSEQDAKEA